MDFQGKEAARASWNPREETAVTRGGGARMEKHDSGGLGDRSLEGKWKWAPDHSHPFQTLVCCPTVSHALIGKGFHQAHTRGRDMPAPGYLSGSRKLCAAGCDRAPRTLPIGPPPTHLRVLGCWGPPGRVVAGCLCGPSARLGSGHGPGRSPGTCCCLHTLLTRLAAAVDLSLPCRGRPKCCLVFSAQGGCGEPSGEKICVT